MLGSILQHVAAATQRYIAGMPKCRRKPVGQFFTGPEVACFMASLFCIPPDKDEISVLDPGAGTGILSAALVDRLRYAPHLKRIHLVCYETDSHVVPVLRKNLDYLTASSAVSVVPDLREENYILSQQPEYNALMGATPAPQKYDLIIGNPPYMKIGKDAPEARAMRDVCYGAPNLYTLFTTMGVFNLAPGAEMVCIIPRSWTSGAYFRLFRKKLFATCALRHIHLFVGRDRVFDREEVLQETMILKLKKGGVTSDKITVTTSRSGSDFGHITRYEADFHRIVRGADQFLYLVTNSDEERAVRRVSSCNQTLRDMGLQMKTGLTVDYRERDALRHSPSESSIPLIFPHHIRQGKVVFPMGRGNEYLNTTRPALRQKNTNYLFVKRFTAKEEPRRLQCGVYLSRQFPNFKVISTENKINFIVGRSDLPVPIVYGLYVIFNSSLYDTYYRILNGSTQVNSTEINSIPVPSLSTIEAMGNSLLQSGDMSVSACNHILDHYV